MEYMALHSALLKACQLPIAIQQVCVPGIRRLHLLPALTSSLAPKMQGTAASEKRTFPAFQPPGLCHWLHSNGSSLKLRIGSGVVELENPDACWPY